MTLANPSLSLSDDGFQAWMLEGVSRTFALTIPQLPPQLAPVVSNAYLLCRIIDTIEDEPGLAPALKRSFCDRFVRALSGHNGADRFADDLGRLLSDTTSPAVRELIREVPRVLRITDGFNPRQRQALRNCVITMAHGMVEFQEQNGPRGLKDCAEVDRYCYHVAGVVGEMLTELFCDYSEEIARHHATLMSLAVSFGQGLQMTNILKDVWEDLDQGACWLPRELFAELGFDLEKLDRKNTDERFRTGLIRLIAIAHGHLEQALRYTLLIPAHETGIRNFCLWAIGMAVLTLRKLGKNLDYHSAQDVKISRNAVRLTIVASRLSATHDGIIKWLFGLAARGIPLQTKTPLTTLRPS